MFGFDKEIKQQTVVTYPSVIMSAARAVIYYLSDGGEAAPLASANLSVAWSLVEFLQVTSPGSSRDSWSVQMLLLACVSEFNCLAGSHFPL